MSRGFTAGDYRFSPSGVKMQTDDAALQHLFDRCETLAKGNIRRFGARRVLQEGAKYHGVWLETQPMGGEMYAVRDVEIALNNVLIFMECQRRDGRMPGMITYRMPWDGLSVHMDWMQGDFFTIPAYKLSFRVGQDKAYLQRLYTALRDFDEYLWSCRDSDGDGCLESWCTWDTGDDNSTRYLVNRVHPSENGAWNGETAPVSDGGLPFESAEYMAYSYAQRETLSKICALLENGEEAMWREKAQQVRETFIQKLWDTQRHFAFDRNGRNEKIDSVSQLNIKCMYQGIFTQEMADDFVREHVMNRAAFFTPLPMPSIAADDPLFYVNHACNNLGALLNVVEEIIHADAQDNSWSGPVQGLTLQRTLRALTRYGHLAETALIGRKWTENLMRTDAFVQQYNPFTGEPAKAEDGYGPTVLATLGYIAWLYGISVDEDVLSWGACSGVETLTYVQQLDGHEYVLRRRAGFVWAEVDGAEAFSFTPGVLVRSDLRGVPMQVCGVADTPVTFEMHWRGRTLRAVIAPNEVLRVTEDGLVREAQVPFTAPYGETVIPGK